MFSPKTSAATDAVGEATEVGPLNVGLGVFVAVGVEVGVGVGVLVGVGVEVGVDVGDGVGDGVGVGIAAVRARIKVFDSPEELVLLPEKRLNFTS